ncbi:hypothetical protein [uncultured Tenacibaculum sp.]|uniref:toxin-antitoxin system YwqK family antitoxin n=1 Tax=uncultured Tenacibaculum sp. TaxID=174713 RepID=UPI00260C2A40|nr:hypothetical protein [uncultured Tenacibaculum sp.]
MKKTIYIFLSIIMFLVSCKKEEKKHFYIFNGKKIDYKLIKSNKDSSFINGYGGKIYPNGNLEYLALFSDGKVVDSLFYYYENGNVREKGLMKNKKRNSWWIYFHKNGKLNKKIEWFQLNGKVLKNQEIYFDEKGNIKKEPSYYFDVLIPDTLKVGQNISRINNYVSNLNNIDTRYLSVIIENIYSESKVRNDTFSDGSSSPFFVINSNKIGKKIIEGKIEEKVLKTDLINKDSTTLTIIDQYRFFRKEVYVAEKHNESEMEKYIKSEFEKMIKKINSNNR